MVLGGLAAFALAGLMVLMSPTTVVAVPDDIPPEESPCFDITLSDPDNPDKVSLCHFTGSSGNPFVLNEVSFSAHLNHQDHHGDCYKLFGQAQVCIQ
jgi:hypothetical protein